MLDNLEPSIQTYLSELNQHFKDNKIKKRDGKLQKFDIFKVLNAVHKSFEGEDCNYAYANITYEVCHDLLHSPKYKPHSTFELEHVQDAIEKILMRNYPDVARKFIVYREQRKRIREDKNLFDVSAIMGGYINQADWRVKENSSSAYSIGGLIMHNATSVISRYCLTRIYPKRIADAHINGDFHIHDLGFGIGVYCQGHSLGQLIERGLVELNGNLASAPAKRFHTLINHMINFVGILQNESAGAQAFGSVDTYAAPFIAYDKLDYPQIKQIVQSFVFGMNVPSRWGSMAPFFNLTLDLTVNPVLAPKPVVIGGSWWKKNGDFIPINSCNFDNEDIWHYSDFQKEMDLFNTAFLEIMTEGDYDGRGFSYPIPTINLTKEFDWDSPVASLLWKLTGKLGTPYFSNFINSDMKPEDSFSMCPMTGDTWVVIRDNNGEYVETMIENLYGITEKIQVRTDSGEWCSAIVTKQPPTSIYEITMDEKIVVKFGENHLQPILNVDGKLKTFQTQDLSVGNKIPFGTEERYYRAITKITKLTNNSPLYCFEVQNKTHLFMLANGMITHNCRLKMDLRELRKRGGGLFGAGERTGSVGVVTINLPRLAYKLKQSGLLNVDMDISAITDLYKQSLNPLLEMAKDSLEIKRKIINSHMEEGLFPYTHEYTKHFNNHFSTIGIIGMHEACLNLFEKPISDPVGRNFAISIGEYIREKILSYQEETGNLYNYEATPGESSSHRFAKTDKKQFPDIITSGEGDNYYYTNSTNLPVNYTTDIFEAMDHQDDLMSQYTGGCVFHTHIGEAISDPDLVKNLVKNIATTYKMPYFSISPTFSVCTSHGYLNGEQPICPTCGEPTEVFARIVGYYRPVHNWNKGKQQEFKERKTYIVNEDIK